MVQKRYKDGYNSAVNCTNDLHDHRMTDRLPDRHQILPGFSHKWARQFQSFLHTGCIQNNYVTHIRTEEA